VFVSNPRSKNSPTFFATGLIPSFLMELPVPLELLPDQGDMKNFLPERALGHVLFSPPARKSPHFSPGRNSPREQGLYYDSVTSSRLGNNTSQACPKKAARERPLKTRRCFHLIPSSFFPLRAVVLTPGAFSPESRRFPFGVVGPNPPDDKSFRLKGIHFAFSNRAPLPERASPQPFPSPGHPRNFFRSRGVLRGSCPSRTQRGFRASFTYGPSF